MSLTVRRITAADVGEYRCVAKNSPGEVDSVIRLYEIPGTTARITSTTTKKNDFKFSTPLEGPDNQFGSAENSDDEEDRDGEEPQIKQTPNPVDNKTKNKSLYYTLANPVNNKQKSYNKNNKIINKFDVTTEIESNLSSTLQGNNIILCTVLCVQVLKYIVDYKM